MAVAFACPEDPAGIIRPAENLEDVDILDARDPGRKGEGKCVPAVRGTEPV